MYHTLKSEMWTMYAGPTRRWRNRSAALIQGDLSCGRHRRVELLLPHCSQLSQGVSEDLLGGLDIHPLEFGGLRTGA